ncbi:MAG: hypothetical protein KatS3mg068_2035 [Candidatus Sericytochromatia bacterium]|nr:MAG: hypothetical protein KatS3mg068_2035 [Candidatus Sericytochromatia bacterium]
MSEKDKDKLKCSNCGALLKFNPDETNLICEYCGSENNIKKEKTKIVENNYNKFLQNIRDFEINGIYVKCSVCAAEFTLNENINADICPFCSASIIITNKVEHKSIKPAYLLPFSISADKARESFKNWVKTLWFAPNDLKEKSEKQTYLKGIYLPFWTYDAQTASTYTGKRGDDYYVTEYYTTYENGRAVRRERIIKKTKWRNVSGKVTNNFDDILICASKSLPRKYVDALEPWDLRNLVPYKDEYLSGFTSEFYQIDLEEGFELAKKIIDREIYISICEDIGGDHQIVTSINTTYYNITFKHILLPVWVSSYKYRGKIYNFVVNARTGEVQGERPWSLLKITLFIIFILFVIFLLILVANSDVCNYNIRCTLNIIYNFLSN